MSGSGLVVIIKTGKRGSCSRIWRSAPKPSSTGIEISRITRSGRSSSALRTASAPSPAWAHVHKPLWALKMPQAACRSSALSSTIRIRTRGELQESSCYYPIFVEGANLGDERTVSSLSVVYAYCCTTGPLKNQASVKLRSEIPLFINALQGARLLISGPILHHYEFSFTNSLRHSV